MRTLLLLLLITFVSCNEKTKAKNEDLEQSLDSLEWIIGKWQRENSNEYETWAKKSNILFQGTSAAIDNELNELINEELTLELKADGIFYGAKVLNQNNGQKIEFKLSNTDFESPIFTNANHDFPNNINYIKISEHQLKVEISGTEGGKRAFNFIRI